MVVLRRWAKFVCLHEPNQDVDDHGLAQCAVAILAGGNGGRLETGNRRLGATVSGRFQAGGFRNLPTLSALHVRRSLDDRSAISAENETINNGRHKTKDK